MPWQLAAHRVGAQLKVVPVSPDGALDIDEYRKLLSPRTKIVAVSHVSNVLGTVAPIASMSRLAHEVGAVVVVDAAQSVPHMKVDVRELDCDFMVFSGHKLYGPMGVGVLYGKSALLDRLPPWQGGGGMIEKVTFEASSPPSGSARCPVFGSSGRRRTRPRCSRSCWTTFIPMTSGPFSMRAAWRSARVTTARNR